MQHVKTGWVLAFAMILGLVAFAVGAQDPDKATTGPESEAMTAPTTEATAEEPDEAPVDESLVLIQLAETIAGQENKPAGEVFSNVQVLRSVPAGRFLRIMRLGFSRSLGVSCDYCHSSSDWASHDNAHKRIARQMAMLTEELIDKLLPALEGNIRLRFEHAGSVQLASFHRLIPRKLNTFAHPARQFARPRPGSRARSNPLLAVQDMTPG